MATVSANSKVVSVTALRAKIMISSEVAKIKAPLLAAFSPINGHADKKR